MSTPKELQEEEYEVLKSIYEGDERFCEVSTTTFNYKFGGEGNQAKSFIVEFSCGEMYPEEPPNVNMDVFFNATLNQKTKNSVKAFVLEQATSLLGSAMIYTLIEAIKENLDQLMTIDETINEENPENEDHKPVEIVSNKKNGKKEQLTKAQKRRILNKQEKGEFPRGWNWVDIVQHLSSTSQKNS